MMKEIKNFKRKELFDYYHNFDNPFIILTTKVDVTNVVHIVRNIEIFILH